MEELDLRELLNMFWTKKVQIILIILIFIVIGVIYTLGFVKPVYTSTTTLLLASLNQKGESNTTITASDINVNAKLLPTYSKLIKTESVIDQVISNLNINISKDAVKNNVTVTSETNTDLINISVSNEDPETAAKIANEMAKVFSEKIKEIYKINNVQVIDEAKATRVASNINHKKDVIMFVFIGVVIAAIYVLIANMLDTTIKTAEDVEKMFKIPVLAAIPLNGIGDSKEKVRKGGNR